MPSKKNSYRRRGLTKAKLLTFGALLFSLGVATSVATTFAWYSLRVLASVENLYLSIDSSDVTLSLKLGDDYEEAITSEDGFTKEDLGLDEDFRLHDVSGMFESSWNNESTVKETALPELRSSYRSRTSYTDTTPATRNEDFVQAVFWLECSDDATIYLDKSSKLEANVEMNKIVAQGDAAKLDKLNEVVHATRVSFYSIDRYIIANPGESNETYYGGNLDLNVDGYYDFDDENNEILYGEYQGTPDYSIVNNQDTLPYENGDVFTSNHKKGTKSWTESSVSIKKEEAVKFSSLILDMDNPLYPGGRTPICELNANEPKRIVISVYIEGWDLHMTDAIADASFDISLSFLALLNK